ncbi:hypothetical protein KR093_010752 [Drosophila rubida]|uniref:Down syndrome cell adhesion molecule-like protein Dscam2 n=1 Tax=Drosophila rubida TaxID=30044 RepID=A0AAD4PPA6_9MUSC|nr:hypothetical protein KR093_010752 [Drosophila rubida]
MLRMDQLAKETRAAQEAETERVRRLEQKQKTLTKTLKNKSPQPNALILDYLEKTKTFVQVHEDIVKLLKPHQIDGLKFMYDSCYGGIDHSRKTSGSGCILAHCMGLDYSMVNFIKPLYLGTEKEFANLYANPIKNGQHKDSSKKDITVMKQRSFVLHKKLSNFVQRKEAELLKTFLPQKFEYVLFIPMTAVQNKLYEYILEAIASRGDSRGKSLITDYTVLRKQKNKKDTKRVGVPHSDDDQPDDIYDSQTDIPSSYTASTTWISGQDYYRLDGKTPKHIRHDMIKRFNNEANRRARVFLISAKAGGQGINLIGANRVIILDTSWNPSSDQQNIFRIFRLGQKKNCYIYRLIAMGTMEEKVYTRSVTKQAMSFRVVDEQQIDRHYNMAELAELYTLTKPVQSERTMPVLPKDTILAHLLRQSELVYKYHEHDSLLENKVEQELSEQEKADAWHTYERELQMNLVVYQHYEPEVQNPGGFIGSNVLIKCNIPSFVKEYVTVTSWLQETNFNIYPSLEGEMRELVPPIMNDKTVTLTSRVGDPLVLACVAYANPKPTYSTSGFPKTQISWFKDGKTLRSGARVRLLSKEHIRITSIVKEDKGMYQCIIKNDIESTQSSAELRLGEVSPQLLYKFIEQTMQPGPSVSLKCSASGNPTPKIVWHLDGFPLPNNDRLMIGQYVTTFGDVISHVNISAVKSEDGGDYECKAISRAGEASHSARLNIYGMPYIRHMPKLSAVAGKVFALKCPIAGYPIESVYIEKVPPKITPFSFARDLNVGDRTSIQCVIGTGDLPLSFTWLKDGIPLPQAANAATTATVDSVSGGLKGTGGAAGLLGSGTGSHLTHSSYSSPSSASEHVANTMNDNGRSGGESNGQVTIRQNDDFTSALSITSVTRDQSGTYTCRVQNDAATVTHSAQLKVNVPPRWILKPTDQDAILGNAVIVSCKADGFPLPTIQWKQSIGDTGEYRDLSFAMDNVNSHAVLVAHSNGSLMISKVNREHEGSYLCQASNGIGAGLSTLIKLTVHVGPSVTVSKKQLSIRRGERITLRCEANGDQPLEISWRSKAIRIDPSYDIRYHIKNSPLARGVSSELTILQTVLTDRGEYTCIASNAYGRDRSVIHVQVQEPPNFPVNLHVRDLGSRSVTLAWSPNDQDSVILGGGGGNNRDSQPISNYILQYKKAGDVWHEHNNQKLLPGDRTTAQLGSLRPAQVYHIRLFAENHLGTSAPSDVLFVQTDSEVPSAPPQDVTSEPLGPQQLLITWRAPVRDSWNGELLGYTISYQKQSTPDSVANHTKVGNLLTEGLNDFRLTGLEKYTQYGITVSAFNVKGDGPPSEVALGHTLEDVPSAAPRSVTCIALTAQNIQISWQSPPKELSHGIIQGYKLLYEPGLLESEYSVRETKITSALSTVLHGLQPYTNYSVQVLAFTRAGEGVSSPPVSCITEEAVPDAPELVKSAVSTESSVIISWLPPRRLNGLITKYNVYIRILEKGQELKILKEMLPAHNRHFEAKDLNFRETYEAWVTASTRVGQGPSTPVIKLVPSTSIPAAIISFSQTLHVNWKSDIKLPCVFVGNPKASAEWKILNNRAKKQFPLEVSNDNTLSLRNIQRNHEGNYSCVARNPIGSDHIVYQLYVQVPPAAPIVSVNSVQKNSVSIQWRVDDIGGAPIKGYTLTYRRDASDWEEIQIDRRVTSYMLEDLQCGTKYMFTMNTYNKIGSSAASSTVSAQTKGNKPFAPHKHSFLRSNTTSVILDLSSWQDGGCPILHYSIEFKRYKSSSDWIIVSNKIETNTRYSIGDLEPGTAYNLRVTANNNAGSTTKEFYFETQNLIGFSGGLGNDEIPDDQQTVFSDAHLIAVIISSIFGTILALIGAFICFKNCE